jgi:hypothetical protein
MADRDHFIVRPDADGHQRQMKRGGAVRSGAGMFGANELSEFPLEGGHFRALRDPSAENDAGGRVRLALVHDRFDDRDH